MHVGRKLRLLRKKNNFTQKEISMGICSTSYYSKIENGKSKPNKEILELFAKKMNVSLFELSSKDEYIPILSKKAFRIYNLIRNNRHEKAKRIFSDFMNQYRRSIDPEVKLITVLLKLRFAILEPDIYDTHKKYQDVIRLIEYKNPEITPLYNRVCGLYHYLYGDLKEAIDLYKELEATEPNKRNLSDIFYQLSLLYNRKGKIYFSNYYLKKAINIYNEKMDFKQSINCYLLKGINYYRLSEYQEAIKYYNRIIEKSTNINVLKKVYHNIALVYIDNGNDKIAKNYLKKSLNLANNSEKSLKTLLVLSKELYKSNKYKRCRDYIKEGLNLARTFKNKEYEIKFEVINRKITDKEYCAYLENVALPFFYIRNKRIDYKKYMIELSDYYADKRCYKQAYITLKKSCKL